MVELQVKWKKKRDINIACNYWQNAFKISRCLIYRSFNLTVLHVEKKHIN